MFPRKEIIVFFVLLVTKMALAEGSWSFSFVDENRPSSQIIVSKLQFEKGDKKVTYQPTALPWRVMEHKKILLQNKEYFVTSWVQGAQSLAIRVFEPNVASLPLVCEWTTFAEDLKDANLRTAKNRPQVSVYTENGKMIWRDCSRK